MTITSGTGGTRSEYTTKVRALPSPAVALRSGTQYAGLTTTPTSTSATWSARTLSESATVSVPLASTTVRRVRNQRAFALVT